MRLNRNLSRQQLAVIGVVALSAAVAAFLRLFVLTKYVDLWFCSDEANIGLMALRFARHGAVSTFIPGVTYGGFLGPGVTGVLMLLTGSPFIAPKLAATLFFLLSCVALFGLADRVAGRAAALVAVVLVGFSPMFLTWTSIRPIGPHGETLCLGTLLMWLTVVLTDRERRNIQAGKPPGRRRALGFFAWGLLAGFAWYTYYLAITYIAPCALFLTLASLRTWFPAWRGGSATLSRLLKMGGAATVGLLIGSLPYWIFAVNNRIMPPFGSTNPPWFAPVLGLRVFSMVGFPIITGARVAWSRSDLIPVLSRAVIYFYLVSAVWFAAAACRARRLSDGKLLIVLHLVFYPVLFSLSSFSYFADQPRYLVGLYSSLPIVLAWGISRTATRSKVLAGTILLLVISTSIYGNLKTTAVQFNTAFDEPTAALIGFLRDQKIRYFYANYWIVYRVMFESVVSVAEPPPEKADLELIGSSFFNVRAERDPVATTLVNKARNPAYVAWVHEAPNFEKNLQGNGRTYKKRQLGRYSVFYAIDPPLPPPQTLK
jgi:hypothetical protein